MDRKDDKYLVLFSKPVRNREGKETYGVLLETYSAKQALFLASELLTDNLLMELWQSHLGEGWVERHLTHEKDDLFEESEPSYKIDGLEYSQYTYFPKEFKDVCVSFIDVRITVVPFKLWNYRQYWFTKDGFLIEPTLAHELEDGLIWQPLTNEEDMPF